MRSLSLHVCASVVAAAACSVASAGPLGSDPNGIPGFTGSVVFDNGSNVSATMDYAVFAPGDYGGADPSGGTDYVYAYQVFANNARYTTTTVGILDGAIVANAGTDPNYAQLGGIDPLAGFPTFQAQSFFSLWNPPVNPGQYSTVLLFTSPQPPTFASASVANGGTGVQLEAPSPLPEPSTLVLLAGGLALLRRRG